MALLRVAPLHPIHVGEIDPIDVIHFYRAAHATLALIVVIDHIIVDKYFAVNLGNGMINHVLVAKLLVRQIVILEDELAQKLGHCLMFLDKVRRRVLFLLQSVPNFVLSDWKRFVEQTESRSKKLCSHKATCAADDMEA